MDKNTTQTDVKVDVAPIEDPIRRAIEKANFSKVRDEIKNTIRTSHKENLTQVALKRKRELDKLKKVRVPSPPGGLEAFLMQAVGAFFAFTQTISLPSYLFAIVGGDLGMWGFIWLFFRLGIIGVSAFFFFQGKKLSGLRERFKKYGAVLLSDGACSFRELAQMTGGSNNTVKKDLKAMVQKGFFKNAFIDEKNEYIVIGKENFEIYKAVRSKLDAKRELEDLRENEPTSPDGIRSEGELMAQSITDIRSRIHSEPVRVELEKLSLLTKKIFERVANSPVKSHDARRFMDYYLPTTIKLVKAYENAEQQPVEGKNIKQTKKEITDSLGLIVKAFERLLDELFAKDALEVHTEISALQMMLDKDGFSPSDF